MANYEDNRIRCSKTTAEALMASDSDAYFKPIDFRKSLGMVPYTKIDNCRFVKHMLHPTE